MPPVHVETLSVLLLLTNDTGRAARFYRDVLGLPLTEEEHDGRHTHYACRLGTVYFTIQAAEDLYAHDPPRIGDSIQICFTVADLNDFLKHLEQLQVQPLHPPLPFEHTTFVTLRDPDGRSVRVMTPWRK